MWSISSRVWLSILLICLSSHASELLKSSQIHVLQKHYFCINLEAGLPSVPHIELKDVPCRYTVRTGISSERPLRYGGQESSRTARLMNLSVKNLKTGPATPNITDKETVVNLAKMTSDAYILDPTQPDWLNTSLGFNFTCRFGWDEDGLRGHIFTTQDNSTVIVAFKGTTIDPRDKTPSKDRYNDILLFSCCCGAQQSYHYSPVCDCSTGYYQCNSNCLTSSLAQNDTYYASALQFMDSIYKLYPNATFWTVGHSLGGSLASLVGLTYDIPAVTFEAPPERLPAQRLGLFNQKSDSKRAIAHHFGNTADPVYMGVCNGFLSSCAFAGFDFESQCFSGKRCPYNTTYDKGWHMSITNHRITRVINDVLEAYDDVPPCVNDDECEDCFNWIYT